MFPHLQLHGAAKPNHQLQDSTTPIQQQLSRFSTTMFVKLERMLDQSLDLNLMLTSLLSKILVLLPAHLEDSIIKGSHSNHDRSSSSGPNLYSILNKVWHCLFIHTLLLYVSWGFYNQPSLCSGFVVSVVHIPPEIHINLFMKFSHYWEYLMQPISQLKILCTAQGVWGLFVTEFAKRGLTHASNFGYTCNSACVGPTALKFGSRTSLSLYLQDWKFQPNRIHSLINQVLSLQSWKIGCIYKIPFHRFAHIFCFLGQSRFAVPCCTQPHPSSKHCRSPQETAGAWRLRSPQHAAQRLSGRCRSPRRILQRGGMHFICKVDEPFITYNTII